MPFDTTSDHRLSRLRFGLCLLCFFLSGISALIYQTAWVRQLELIFGASEMALVAVLAGFMGGLAVGAAFASRVVGKLRRPMLFYAAVEVAVAFFAMMFPVLLSGVEKIQETAFIVENLSDLPPSWQTGAVALILSFLLLLIPTALMGMTLPLMIRFVIRSDREMGWMTAVVYAVNTAGAASGALVSVFLLLPAFGLGASVWIAAGINLVIAAGAIFLNDRNADFNGDSFACIKPSRFHWVYPVMLISGAISFCGEVTWTRLLSQILGGTVYAFGTVLAIFLVGLSIGSGVASRFVRSALIARKAFCWVQVGIAITLAVGFLSMDPWIRSIQNSLEGGGMPFGQRLLFATVVLGPIACFIGATFPLATRVAAESHEAMAGVSARVFSWNTIGAIVGAVGTGVLLLPLFQFTGTIQLMAVGCLVLALVGSLAARPLQKAPCVAGLGLLVAMPWVPFEAPSGVLQFAILNGRVEEGQVLFRSVGRVSNVILFEKPAVGDWTLVTNGLPEATIQARGNPPQWFRMARSLPLFGMLGTPDAKTMMVVGLGGGLALENVPGRIEKIEVVELEPEVLAANQAIADRRRKDPLKDPRVRIHLEDARSALRLAEEAFDIVVSQPSHPFTSGSSHLYTQEFFELVHSRLRSEGTFVQWMGTDFVDEGLLLSLLSTLSNVFQNVEVYLPPNGGGIVFVARDSLGSTLSNVSRVFSESPEEFADAGFFLPEEVVGAYLAGGEDVKGMLAGTLPVTDQKNIFQTRGPHVLGSALRVDEVIRLFAENDPFDLKGFQGDPNRLVLQWLIDERYAQADAFAQQLADPYLKSNALGQIDLAKKRHEEARERFRAALESDSTGVREAAAAGLFFSYQRAFLRFDPTILKDADVPQSYAATLAMEYSKREDWESFGDVIATLKDIEITHPLYGYVLTLRMVFATHEKQWQEVIEVSELPGRWPDSLSEGAMIADAYFELEEWESCFAKLRQLPKVIRRTDNPPASAASAVRRAMEVLKRFPDEQKDAVRYRALLSELDQMLR